MTLEDFKEIHENKPPSRLLELLVQELEMNASDRSQATLSRYCWRNEETAQWYDREAKAHHKRAEWLFDRVMNALVMQETRVS